MNSCFGTRIVRGEEIRYKLCKGCVEYNRERNKSPDIKAKKRKWKEEKVDHIKAVTYAYNHRNDVKAAREASQKSEDGKKRKAVYTYSAKGRATAASYEKSEAGKASVKRRNAKAYKKIKACDKKRLAERIRTGVSTMLSGKRFASKTLSREIGVKNRDELMAHFVGLMEDGMSMQNYGTRWEIGHRIARAMYNKCNAKDVFRCWQFGNLFPQDKAENKLLSVTLPSDEVLLTIKDLWPCAWNDKLPQPTQRAAFEAAARWGTDVCVL
jgi:Zn ribbon nucleic-acid-binding protein